MNKKELHKNIGFLIKEEVERQGLSAKKFGEMISCERANVYKIFNRTNIDTALLGLISKVLKHDFFLDIVKDPSLSGVEDESALKEIADRIAVLNLSRLFQRFWLSLASNH